MGDQVPVTPPSLMIDGEIRSAFFFLAQSRTSQHYEITSQVQDITAQVNHELEPCMPHYYSRLRDFTMMNPLIMFGSKADEDPQDLLDEDYKIVFATGVTRNKYVKLDAYQLKDKAQTWYTQWRDNRALRGGRLARFSKGHSLKGSLLGN